MSKPHSQNMYFAIIGDIIESKKLNNRDEIQKKLQEILCDINYKYLSDISAKFIITLGDEFQGLLHYGEHLLNILNEIQRRMYPVRIRFGVGIGEITTEINFEMAIGADGPAYYKAREAVEILKKNEKKQKVHVPDIRIEIDNNAEVTLGLNTILSLMSVVKGKWSDRQREIVNEVERCGGSQKKCADNLKIAPSSVQRGLRGADYYAYKRAVDNVHRILKGMGENCTKAY